MIIKLTDEEGKVIVDILKKQIEKTAWVIENKSVQNESFLQKRVDVMYDLIKQIEQGMGVFNVSTDDDSLDIDNPYG